MRVLSKHNLLLGAAENNDGEAHLAATFNVDRLRPYVVAQLSINDN